MVDSTQNKNLTNETNLTDIGFANSARTMIWYPVFIHRTVDLVLKKTAREFLVGRWTLLLSSLTEFSKKTEKFH